MREGLRLFRTSPGFAAVAVLTLALGISATTAIFSVVYATFLAPLPYRDPGRLVMVFTRMDGYRHLVDAGDFAEWKRHATVFADLNAWTVRNVTLAEDGRPEHVAAGVATPGLLAMMGYGHPLALGRDFRDGEGAAGGEEVVILSHRLWQARFGGDRGLLGRRIRIDGRPHLIVGVLGAGPADRNEARLWLPHVFTPQELKPDVPDLRHYVVGRLKPGITPAAAHASLSALAERLAEGGGRYKRGASVEPFRNSLLAGHTRSALLLLLGAVAFVLLIACANVASLLLARGSVRQRELALRASLGASPAAIARQLLTESLLLALAGGGLGVAIAAVLLRTVMALMPAGALPSEADVRLSLPVLLVTLAISALCALLFGCAPAWRAANVDLSEALKAAAPSLVSGRDRLRRALVVAECALALVLLAGGHLAVRGLHALARVDMGFRTEGLLTFSLPVPPDRLKDGEEIAAFYRELVDRVHAIPGVRSASVSTTLPLHASGFAVMTFDVAGAPPAEPSNRPAARLNVVSPGYFATFGIPLERGRGPGEQDRAGAPLVAVVNEAFVKRFLPDGDPLGRRLAIKRLRPGLKLAPAVDWEVVGVSRDVRNADARSEPVPEITVPFDQSPWPETAMAVRTSGAPASVKPGVAAAIRAMDPDLPMADVKTMVQVVNDSMASDRFNTVLFGGFAAMALLLAAVGIYALMSFAVAQRTHEIGLRMALGAGRAQVLREVLRDGMGTALLGTVVGAAGAWGVHRLMRGMVYGVGGVDAAGFAAVASTLLGAALVACLVPARRAASVDPIAALRRQ